MNANHLKKRPVNSILRLKMAGSSSPRRRNTFHLLQSFTQKLPPSLTINSTKIKTLIHTLIFPYLHRLLCHQLPKLAKSLQINYQLYRRIFSASLSKTTICLNTLIHTLLIPHVVRFANLVHKAATLAVKIVRKRNLHVRSLVKYFPRKKMSKNRKLYAGSYRFYFNWSSRSHVLPVPAHVLAGYNYSSRFVYGSRRNSTEALNGDRHTYFEEEIWGDSELSGYLQWLEERAVCGNFSTAGESESNYGSYNKIDELADMFIEKTHERFLLEKQESDRRFREMMARSF